jgi:DNA polymerase
MVKPAVTLALGATASLGVLGRKIAVTEAQGQALTMADGSIVIVTVHPSYLLRLPDEAEKAREREAFVRDLQRVRTLF